MVLAVGKQPNRHKARNCSYMESKNHVLLSKARFVLGFASIIGSIAIWFLTGGTELGEKEHAERFGIFVGLWAPTFFILSNRFGRFAENKA